ncbi:hypothetical protein J4440_00820 [Candidatus Woesearchaeota archaeon]|nr:hypothetical protein [Candidatus Woesearchaeota archaeon]
MTKNIPIAILSLILISNEACFYNKSCHSWNLKNTGKLETCIFYDNNGDPKSSEYTIYNGWNLPVLSAHDNKIDGIDKKVKYHYNNHHKIKRKETLYGNKRIIEERIYNEKDKVTKILVDLDDDGIFDKIIDK